MVTVQLNDDQANALLALIDLAIKAGGIKVAEAGVVLTKIIQEAATPQQPALPGLMPQPASNGGQHVQE